MSLKFNQLKNNCYYLEMGNKIVLISYESIIGVIIDDILYLSDFYIGYSKTTSRHINLFKNNLFFVSEIIVNNEELYKLVNNY